MPCKSKTGDAKSAVKPATQAPKAAVKKPQKKG